MTGLGLRVFFWLLCLPFGLICLLKSRCVFPSGQMALTCCVVACKIYPLVLCLGTRVCNYSLLMLCAGERRQRNLEAE